MATGVDGVLQKGAAEYQEASTCQKICPNFQGRSCETCRPVFLSSMWVGRRPVPSKSLHLMYKTIVCGSRCPGCWRRDPAGALVAEGVGEGHHSGDIPPVAYREGVVAVGLAPGELGHQGAVHPYRERGPVELFHKVCFNLLNNRKVDGRIVARTAVLVFHVKVPAVLSDALTALPFRELMRIFVWLLDSQTVA